MSLGLVITHLQDRMERANLGSAESTVFSHMLSVLGRGEDLLAPERPEGCRSTPTPDHFSMQQLLCIVYQHFERFPQPHAHPLKEYELLAPVPARLDLHNCAMLLLAQWSLQWDDPGPQQLAEVMSLGTLACSHCHLAAEHSLVTQRPGKQTCGEKCHAQQ